MLAAGIAATLAVLALFGAAQQMAERAASGYEKAPAPAGEAPAAADAAEGESGVNWDYWLGANPDVIGWVTVPGTGIDYPVMQARDESPTYYLSHDAYGGWDYHGVPYLSSQCAEGGLLGSGNALVFGHHLNDGTMFSALAGFSDAGYAAEHSPIMAETPQGSVELWPLAVDVVDASREKVRVSFADAADHAEWLRGAVAASDLRLVGDGFDYASAEHVVTLCTCSYSRWANERTLVICAAREKDR